MKPPPSEKPEDFVAGMHEVFSHLLGITNLRMIRPGERNPVSVGDEDSVTSRLNDVECNFIEMLTNVRRTRHELHLWEKLRVERLDRRSDENSRHDWQRSNNLPDAGQANP